MAFFYILFVLVAIGIYFLLRGFNVLIQVSVPIFVFIILSSIFFHMVKKAVKIDAQSAGQEITKEDLQKLKERLSKNDSTSNIDK